MIVIPILSIFGYSQISAKLFSTRLTYCLLPVVAALISILYLAGGFGVIHHTTYAVYISGIISFIYYVTRNYNHLILLCRSHLAELFFLFLITILYALYTNNAYFQVWDDFSQWGILSKELLLNHLFESQLIY